MSKAPPGQHSVGVARGKEGTTPQRALHLGKNPEQIPDERVTTAMHTMQDHLQQTIVISQRRSQKTLTEQAASKTNGNAANEAILRRLKGRRRQSDFMRRYTTKPSRAH